MNISLTPIFTSYTIGEWDGQSFISVIIDQQRYINRLIMLNDLAIQSAVKGVKMIPKDSVPDGMSNREFAEQFVEIGSFIFTSRPRAGTNRKS